MRINMSKKAYDILSWIWLISFVILFSASIYFATSSTSSFAQKNTDDLRAGNIPNLEENLNSVAGDFQTFQIIKYVLYILGGIYSIIIFALCFKLKIGILEKLIALIGGIWTYGGLALLLYFFDVRKKFAVGVKG